MSGGGPGKRQWSHLGFGGQDQFDWQVEKKVQLGCVAAESIVHDI